MTTTEVMREIEKMSLAEKHQLIRELIEQLEQVGQTAAAVKEERFISGLKQKGLLTEMPLRLPDDEIRRRFERIEVKGEPLSETIIKERG